MTCSKMTTNNQNLLEVFIRAVFIRAIFYFCISDDINMEVYVQFSIFWQSSKLKKNSNLISRTPYFVMFPLFCTIFPFLKLQNKGNILCIQDSDSKILRF